MEMKLVYLFGIFLLFGARIHFTNALISFSTPNERKYLPLEPKGISVQGAKTLRFAVKATHDVHVGLYDSTSASLVPNDIYEIVIGGWGNGKSVIRTSQQGSLQASVSHVPLSATEFRDFWLSWEDAIRVGSGYQVGLNEFLYLADTTYQVEYVAVFTAFGSTGEWQFEDFSLLASSSVTSDPLSTSQIYLSTSPSEDSTVSDIVYSSVFATDTLFSVTSSTDQSSTFIEPQSLMDNSVISQASEESLFFITSSTEQSSTYMGLESSMDSGDFRVSGLTMETTQIITGINTLELTSMINTEFISEYSTGNTIPPNSPSSVEKAVSDVPFTTVVLTGTTTSLIDQGVTSLSSMSTSGIKSTTAVPVTKILCGCRCVHKNITSSELMKNVEKLIARLSVPKQNLSSRRRRRSSAHDARPSSQSIGSGIIFFGLLPFILIILADIQKVCIFYFVRR